MALPAGYFYKDGAYWGIDGAGPYAWDGATMTLIGGGAISSTWSKRSRADAYQSGTRMLVSDYNNAVMRAEGAYWVPDGQQVTGVHRGKQFITERATWVAAPEVAVNIAGAGMLVDRSFTIELLHTFYWTRKLASGTYQWYEALNIIPSEANPSGAWFTIAANMVTVTDVNYLVTNPLLIRDVITMSPINGRSALGWHARGLRETRTTQLSGNQGRVSNIATQAYETRLGPVPWMAGNLTFDYEHGIDNAQSNNAYGTHHLDSVIVTIL